MERPISPSVDEVGEDVNSQQVLIAGLFDRKHFLDIIQNFTVFEPVDGRIIKKVARYQQFRAVHKTIERIKTGATRKDKSGVIWHTQGSGKSLTMVFLTVKMRRDEELRNYKLVFLTDRTQLDGQLTKTFSNAQNETVYNATSVKHLKDLLAKDSSDIITAMVQKFQENADDFDFPTLNDSDKIIVLADEAHRTQYGSLGAAINMALPNAPKIAFTGTPGLITAWANQLLPAPGPKKSPARTRITCVPRPAAASSFCSSCTRIRPLTVEGSCGLSSVMVSKTSTPKL